MSTKQQCPGRGHHGHGLARRDFLLGALASPILAALAGCRRGGGTSPNAAAVLEEVEAYHRTHGELPPNPTAAAWDPAVDRYPRIHEQQTFVSQHSQVHGLVTRALMLLNPEHLDNPLRGLVRAGDSVTIKPNWCTQACFPFPITHPSVVYPLVEYALQAGASKVTIVEAPMTLARGCDWFWSSALVGVDSMIRLIRDRFDGVDVRFVDGNADDFVWVDAGEASELRACEFAGLDHDGHTGFAKNMFFDVADCHGNKPGKYRPGLSAIARSYLDCDVFINVPKLKTHGYTGMTAAIKNLMGLNIRSTIHQMPADVLRAYKDRPDYAEWRESPMRDVPHFDRSKLSGKTGFWLGVTEEDRYNLGFANDVLWRTLADVNKIILYAAANGRVMDVPQRRCLTVVDGIIGTDGNGPVNDSTVHSNCIIAGGDPVAVDAAGAYVMGWHPEALGLIQNCSACTSLPFGTMKDYWERIVGIDPGSPCFDTRFKPPETYDEQIIAPNKLVRA